MVCVVFFALSSLTPAAKADFSEFEVESASASLSTNQAGAHADLTTEFSLKTELSGGDVAQARDVIVTLPPGLLGDPTNFPRCTMEELEKIECAQATQVGLSEALLLGNTGPIALPIYNMVPPREGNVVARLGFHAGFYPVTINIRVHPEDEYRATASLEGIAAPVALREATTTIWGVPGSPIHDSERITPQEGEKGERPPGGRPTTGPHTPFLSNPTRCGVPLDVSIAADSYPLPGIFSTRTAHLGSLAGCGKLSFSPRIDVVPTTSEAAAPTGLDIDLKVPQDETPGGLATSHMRNANVALPEGMTLNPGAADGLGSCDAAQVAYLAPGPAHCPDAAKLGSAELDVVGLEHPLQGSVYQRTPEPGNLFRIWIVADELGVHVALPGGIQLDSKTGQVTSSFVDNPQVPVREVKLHISGGPRAPLANPSRCGAYGTAWRLDPWSGGAAASGTSTMTIDGNCEAGGFSPKLNAGTTVPVAGAFAPLLTELLRDSAEENISSLSLRLPPGLLAKLKGVPLCEAAAAASGDCPAASQIGAVAVAAGAGSNPLWIPQPGKQPTAVYLTGPYKGAPYGVAVKVPAQAGPFDLGTVTTMVALDVDPVTARVVAKSDSLPQILEGVPVSYRDVRVYLDRRDFTVNPTSCRQLSSTATVVSVSGTSAEAKSPFRVGGCRELSFRPKLSVSLKGGTKRNSHPALRAVLKMPSRETANVGFASVALPHALFLAQEHIRTICTRVQFAADKCPAGSIYGHVRATSPLLGYPLSGPVYLRSSSHPLPDLVAALRGPGQSPLEVDIAGRIDSFHGGLRTTFEAVPDAAVSKFVISMFGGQKSLLSASVDLCRRPLRATATFKGQNGADVKARPSLQVRSCARPSSR